MCKATDLKESDNGVAATETLTNQKWVLSRRPQGAFDPSADAKLVTEQLSIPLTCPPDSIIVETQVLSIDAFLRTMMDEEAYHGSIPIGGTIPALGYGKVIFAGADSGCKVGSVVQGMLAAETYATVKAKNVMRKINFPFFGDTASLGLLGLTTGLTAYTGVYYVTKSPRRGETAVVTGAAGAVGSIACQLAKATGARVVGIAGGEMKKKFLLEEMGLDGAVDYKHPNKSLEEQLEECCPNGIDFIYDNVGGETLDCLLNKINPNGRVVVCGAISQYSGNLNKGLVRGPSNYLKLAERGAEMKGFNVMQYISKMLFAMCGMTWMYWRGKVVMREHVEKGIESFPHALGKMFSGGHIGKMLVNVKAK